MPEIQIDSAQLRRAVEEDVKRQKRLSRVALFITHLAMSVVFTLIIWGISAEPLGSLSETATDTLTGVLITATIAMFMGILMHGLSLFAETKAGERSMREHAVLQALQEQVLELATDDPEASEKPKRDQVMRLVEDGELRLEDDGELPLEEPEAPRSQRAGRSDT